MPEDHGRLHLCEIRLIARDGIECIGDVTLTMVPENSSYSKAHAYNEFELEEYAYVSRVAGLIVSTRFPDLGKSYLYEEDQLVGMNPECWWTAFLFDRTGIVPDTADSECDLYLGTVHELTIEALRFLDEIGLKPPLERDQCILEWKSELLKLHGIRDGKTLLKWMRSGEIPVHPDALKPENKYARNVLVEKNYLLSKRDEYNRRVSLD
jgi:hypothetical protein